MKQLDRAALEAARQKREKEESLRRERAARLAAAGEADARRRKQTDAMQRAAAHMDTRNAAVLPKRNVGSGYAAASMQREPMSFTTRQTREPRQRHMYPTVSRPADTMPDVGNRFWDGLGSRTTTLPQPSLGQKPGGAQTVSAPNQPVAGFPFMGANDLRKNIGQTQLDAFSGTVYNAAADAINRRNGENLFTLPGERDRLNANLAEVQGNIDRMEAFYRENGMHEDQLAYESQLAARDTLNKRIADMDSKIGKVQQVYDELEQRRPAGAAPMGLDRQMSINRQSGSGDAWKTQGIPRPTVQNAQSYRIAANHANRTYGAQYGKAWYELREANQQLEDYRQKLKQNGREGDSKLTRLEANAAQKQAAYDEVNAYFDEVDKLRPQGESGQTVRDSTDILRGYYQPPTFMDIPILGDVIDGAYQMFTQQPSLKNQMQRDKLEGKDGIGLLPAVGAGLTMGGNSFNDTVLGGLENLLDATGGTWLGKQIDPNYKNIFTTLREKNAALGQAAYGDALENASGVEKTLMNVVSSGVNSGAHMALGGMAGKLVGGAMGIGSSMQPITAMQQATGAAAVSAANMSSFVASSMTDAYDRAEADGDPPLKIAARTLAAGIASMIANNETTENFMKKMGLGIDVDDVLAAQYTSGRMINNWGEAALRWAEDTLTNQALAEGTQEVVELILDRSLDAAFTGNLLNPEFWEGFGGELKENFFYGAMSGALYNTMALPSFAPSRHMLGQMISGETETTPETIVKFIEQTGIDARNPDLQQEAQRVGIPDQMPAVQEPEAETNVPAAQETLPQEAWLALPDDAAVADGQTVQEAAAVQEAMPLGDMPVQEADAVRQTASEAAADFATEAAVDQAAVDQAIAGNNADMTAFVPETTAAVQDETVREAGQQAARHAPQQAYYDSREEVGKRFRKLAKPLVEQTRDLWKRIQQIKDPILRTLKETAYEMLFQPLWDASINEQFYIDYPHLRPKQDVERRKRLKELAEAQMVSLQGDDDKIHGKPWSGGMSVVAESLQQSKQTPLAQTNQQRNWQKPNSSRDEMIRRFQKLAAPLMEKNRDFWNAIQQTEDPVERKQMETKYLRIFQPVWEITVNGEDSQSRSTVQQKAVAGRDQIVHGISQIMQNAESDTNSIQAPTTTNRFSIPSKKDLPLKTAAITYKPNKESITGSQTNTAIVAANGLFVNRSELLYRNAKKIQPIKGFEDFTCHADPDNFWVDLTGAGKEEDYFIIPPKEYAERIKASSTYKGGNIRIISCQAGAKKNGAAQQLANSLKVCVLAPTEKVFVSETGDMFITDNDTLAEIWYTEPDRSMFKETGEWKLFKPQGG